MTPERWRQVEAVLQAALEREPEERAALLDNACAGDPELRNEVESLLESAQASQRFLDSNVLKDAAPLLDASESDSLVGRSLGPYSIEKQIGWGGMGAVYLAEDVRLGRRVALKLLDSSLTADGQSRERFLREARLASALDHPNICTIHDVGEAEGRPFIAMQYIEGKTLRRQIDGRPLPLDSLLSITHQIAGALSAAHERGIVHRDIKSGNIIVTPQGQAKVLDFGLARLIERSSKESDQNLTMTGQVMGTPASMSPEQARGERVDHRSDIFSFGCVLYEMATGQIPFKGRSSADVISELLTQPHTPAVALNNEIQPRLSAVIDRALAKEPEDRYQSVREMMPDLSQVVAEAGGLDHLFSSADMARRVLPLVPTHRTPPRNAWRRLVHQPAVIFALIIAALSLLGVALSYFSRPKQPVSIKSIAVLPFKPLSADGRDEALELGMADTLIARLSSIREVDVRPISAVHKYTGLDQDAVAAGREQQVHAVLDGHIQKAGDTIRVTVRLIRVEDGSTIWADKFDNEMTNIFAVQDSISERVAEVLAVTLVGGEKERLTKHHTENSEAYQLYLKGRYHLNRLTDDGFLKGRDYFQQAIDLDQNYAAAYAGLADAYQMLSGYNALAPNDGFPKAKAAAMEALRLDEGLAEAHTALGVVKLLHDWDWPGAEREFKRAIEINQSNSDAHLMYGYYLAAMERFDEAQVEMKRAQELDPLSLGKIIGTGEILYQQRRYDQAAEQYRKALEMDPNSGLAHWGLGNVYVQKAMYDEAISEYKKAIPLSGDSPDELASLGYAYARAGKRREAQTIIEELKERSKRRYISPTIIAFIYGGLGENDEAFALLEKSYNGRDFILVLLKVDPTFDPLRSDPRFTDLMRRVGKIT
ncbi:MAG TPA: protein kinase [Pyrinomonadaceae bacterium]|nr:protein kinase [Pyrinomonadaceae bacterium]